MSWRRHLLGEEPTDANVMLAGHHHFSNGPPAGAHLFGMGGGHRPAAGTALQLEEGLRV